MSLTVMSVREQCVIVTSHCHSVMVTVQHYTAVYDNDDILQDKLAERSSKVKSLVCHPGLSQTSLIPNMAASMPMGWMITPILRLVLRSQGPGDGALPLLAATVNPDANTGDFYYPSFPGSSGKVSTTAAIVKQH